jgi:hypothetical protein
MMRKSREGRCFIIEAQSSVHQRTFIIEVGRKISIQSHVLKNDLNELNYRKYLISDKLRWDPIGVHWIAETSRTLEIRSLLSSDAQKEWEAEWMEHNKFEVLMTQG